MNIEERIKEVDLRPSDIVKLQAPPSQPVDGKTREPIDLSQASGWIKNPTATKAIEQLLWRLCDEKVESGLTFSKPGRKKESVVAEIFSEPKPIPDFFVTGDGSENAVKTCDFVPTLPPIISKPATERILQEKPPAKKPSTPKPEKRTVNLHPFAANTMDGPMIRRLKSDRGVSFWVLYCAKNKYRLELADAGCSIVTEEGTFVLSDFAKK